MSDWKHKFVLVHYASGEVVMIDNETVHEDVNENIQSMTDDLGQAGWQAAASATVLIEGDQYIEYVFKKEVRHELF